MTRTLKKISTAFSSCVPSGGTATTTTRGSHRFNRRRWKNSSRTFTSTTHVPREIHTHLQPKTATRVEMQDSSCHNCGADERFLEDTGEHVSCVQCAHVQQQIASFVEPTTRWGMNSGRYRVKKHRYERKIYFRELIRGIRGEKRATIADADYEKLKQSMSSVSGDQWRAGRGEIIVPHLKALKLTKFKASRLWLAFKLSKGICRPVKVLYKDFKSMLYLFHQVEEIYEKVQRRVAPKRKIFMNYPSVFACLCNLVGKPEYCLDLLLPEDEKSRCTQGRLWRAICAKKGWPWSELQFKQIKKKRKRKEIKE